MIFAGQLGPLLLAFAYRGPGLVRPVPEEEVVLGQGLERPDRGRRVRDLEAEGLSRDVDDVVDAEFLHALDAKAVQDNGVTFSTTDVSSTSVAVVEVYASAETDHGVAVGDDVFNDIADKLLDSSV